MEDYSREAMREEDRKTRILREMLERYPLRGEMPNVASFDELSAITARLRNEFGRDEVLFRGQEDANWTLQPTLSRQPNAKTSLRDYYHKVDRVLEKLETFSDKKWNRRDLDEWEKIFPAEIDQWGPSLYRGLPQYELLINLRHLSFPSPLLDWTASPYVATFFSFERPSRVDNRAIFALIERPFRAKAGVIGQATLCSFGPYVVSHRRHYLQQAQYTICAFHDRAGVGDWHLQRYEDVVTPRGVQSWLGKSAQRG
jgi:hypothetical protein